MKFLASLVKAQKHHKAAKDKSRLQSNSAQSECDLWQTDTVWMDPTDQAQDMSIPLLGEFILKSNNTDLIFYVVQVGSDEC